MSTVEEVKLVTTGETSPRSHIPYALFIVRNRVNSLKAFFLIPRQLCLH